ncbi:MAG: nucleotidyltransferase domain-containing protein [Bacteroidota bacterium]|nr:nucleotidyltransferase domain-containing protein [Bacteroidota bacterium]MDP4197690.1 nucleotidyltransferase domain-containing protein [Bacteroidota bacterium]
MVDSKVIEIVKKYLSILSQEGITISKAYLYGSQARGTATEDSDIDLMVISPLFDENTDKYAPILWLSTRKASYKIEPIAIGEKRFQTDDMSPLIETVRQEGIEIAA